MNDTTNPVGRIESANPVPSQSPFPAGALSSDGLLARIDERSLAMASTQTRVRPTDAGKQPGRGRGPLIAAAVAVALILIIGLPTLNVLTGDENPGTVEPQPSTTVPSTVTDAPQGAPLDIVNGFIAARNQHSADAMASFLATNATITGDLTRTVAGYGPVVEWERITGWHFTLGTCETPISPAGLIRLQCPFTWENDWSRALGLGPVASVRTAFTFTFTVPDGQIERLEVVLDVGEMQFEVPGENYLVVNDPFVDWLESTHADDMWAIFDASQCFPGGACTPLMTPDALDLWERYSDEFVEFVGDQGSPEP
ncbi:MAG TPA: hypothetical protein VGC11_14195 [Acidimicrobiia bacterium]|jgi:hypothetical protein